MLESVGGNAERDALNFVADDLAEHDGIANKAAFGLQEVRKKPCCFGVVFFAVRHV